MTATILLIRHAAHDDVGRRLTGRLPGRSLSGEGRGQASALARVIGYEAIDIIQSSPRERAQETAAAIAGGRAVETVAALDEIDFGGWAGKSFDELDGDPLWRDWNEARGTARPPAGESMAEATQRAVGHVEETAAANPGKRVAMVSHSDIIRGVVAHAVGLPLDNLLRFDIDPASVTRLEVGDWGARLTGLNETCR